MDSGQDVSGRIWMDEFPGWSWFRDDGNEWLKWGHFNDMAEPDLTQFTWINQSSATVSSLYGPAVLSSPGNSGDNVNMLVQTTPSTPYILNVGFTPQIDPVNSTSCGVVLRESSTGKFIFFRFLFDTTSVITASDIIFSLDKFTNPNSLNSNYNVMSAGFLRGFIIWFQIIDDGTNISWGYSCDGQSYVNISTQNRTDFLLSGPDQVGFAIDSNNSGGSTGMTLLSWSSNG